MLFFMNFEWIAVDICEIIMFDMHYKKEIRLYYDTSGKRFHDDILIGGRSRYTDEFYSKKMLKKLEIIFKCFITRG